ncbi:porin family protein [Flavobacterium notoginsengisoli]|uniref:porin family protein n=1 Tax=Flavobacterium notoginsengisoli TaxID=1478199 RepID=UPI00362587D3
MKKFFLLSALFVALTGYSQIHIGAKAGANLSKLDGQAFDDKFEFGYQLGGFVYFNLTDFVGVQGEVLFNQTNTKVSDDYRDVFDNAFKKNKTLNYVSVPVLLRLNSEGLITILAGPQFSFLANNDDSFVKNGKKLFKKTDFSAVAGAEINIRPLTIYARYVWGFSDISDFGNKANSEQFQAGLSLRLF